MGRSSWRRAALAGLGVLLGASMLGGCYARDAEPPAAAEPALGEPVQFTFGTLTGDEVSSDTTRGRTTALLFVTTYDLASQAQTQLLREVLSSHKPVANAAIVMMEPPRAAELARVWAESLGLTWPIAMATPSLMAGDSQLGRINGVPTLIVLDRRGRIIAKNEGALNRQGIRDCLARADAR
ncbi:MAG TPA: hypothetical protein VHP33_05845 [Polyangiaceae bacterium]|nr:hypothetical protein [Polyangiaceae bacterium]